MMHILHIGRDIIVFGAIEGGILVIDKDGIEHVKSVFIERLAIHGIGTALDSVTEAVFLSTTSEFTIREEVKTEIVKRVVFNGNTEAFNLVTNKVVIKECHTCVYSSHDKLLGASSLICSACYNHDTWKEKKV